MCHKRDSFKNDINNSVLQRNIKIIELAVLGNSNYYCIRSKKYIPIKWDYMQLKIKDLLKIFKIIVENGSKEEKQKKLIKYGLWFDEKEGIKYYDSLIKEVNDIMWNRQFDYNYDRDSMILMEYKLFFTKVERKLYFRNWYWL